MSVTYNKESYVNLIHESLLNQVAQITKEILVLLIKSNQIRSDDEDRAKRYRFSKTNPDLIFRTVIKLVEPFSRKAITMLTEHLIKIFHCTSLNLDLVNNVHRCF